MSRKDEPQQTRKVWRMSANAPLGEIITVAPAPEPREVASPRVDEWSSDGDWVTSSWDLLTGLEIKDYTDRVPPRVFDKLFRD